MDRQQLEAAMAAQEALRGQLPDSVVDTTLDALRMQLATLDAGQRRRQATVLFADVHGFTALAESMDAEQVRALVNRLWTLLDAAVVDHHGHIDKHIGDALMAVWGASATREDDPEEAIRAGLAMQHAVASFRAESGFDVALRVGINTGPVMFGSVGSVGEVTAMGDTVNVASRLEQAAPIGGVLVSHETYRHVRGVFDARAEMPLEVKGKSAAVSTYLIQAARQRPFREPSRGVEGIETRIIGRDAELATLQAHFDAVAGGDGALLVVVEGQAGVGKSRLLYEFATWLDLADREVFHARGRAVASRRHQPRALLRDVVAGRFGILDSDDATTVVAKLADGAAAIWTPHEAAVVASWLGFDLSRVAAIGAMVVGPNLVSAGRAHLARYVRALSERGPVVILLEDLHWADDESLEAIADLVRTMDDAAMLTVGTARPELAHERPQWAAGVGRQQRLRLDALSADDTRCLVGEILQRADRVPPEVVELVVARAEGNAFFVEEIVKSLIDAGAIIRDDNDTWWIEPERIDPSTVPATLTGIVQSRLDALDEVTRSDLQRAAVVGRVFWEAAVAAVAGGPVHLRSAVDRELILRRRASTFPSTPELAFQHALIHEVVYETVLLSDRPAMHRRAATWLGSVVADRRDEYLVELAEHHRRGDEPAAAAALLAEAAALALRTGAPRDACHLADDSLALARVAGMPADPSLLLVLGRAHRRLGNLAGSSEVLTEALAAARLLGGDRATLVECYYEASYTASALGEYEAARRLLDDALPMAEEVGGTALAHLLTGLAWSHFDAGDVDAAVATATRAVSVARATDDPEALQSALTILGATAGERHDWDLAFRSAEDAITCCRRLGDLSGEAVHTSNLGVIHHLLADELQSTEHYRRAEEAYRASLELHRQIDGSPDALVMSNLSEVVLRLGEVESALALTRTALGVAHGNGALPIALSAIVHHGEALVERGDAVTGLRYIGVVRHHPALGNGRIDVERLVERLRATGLDLTEVDVPAVIAYDDVVAAIIGGPPSTQRPMRPAPTGPPR